MDSVKQTHDQKTAFVELLKITSILSGGATYKRLIIHHLAMDERTFYRRIHTLKQCGVGIVTDSDGRYTISSLPAWIKQAVTNLSQQLHEHTETTPTH